MAQIEKAIGTAMVVVMLVVFSALIIGTILGSSAFSSLTIINTTALADTFGTFVTNLVAFLAIMGTVLGIVWLVGYVKQLFDKKEGLGAIAA